jgi:MFS family permease
MSTAPRRKPAARRRTTTRKRSSTRRRTTASRRRTSTSSTLGTVVGAALAGVVALALGGLPWWGWVLLIVVGLVVGLGYAAARGRAAAAREDGPDGAATTTPGEPAA